MPKRTSDQSLYWSQTNKLIGQQLRAYYRACLSEELPPRLRAVIKRMDGQTGPSSDQIIPNKEIEHP